ncbi:MAG: GGDEF domain-containing protein [Pseudomonadales bacterium]|nr:GGDEF domain-containing protein [Pseudomonadales bacterium]
MPISFPHDIAKASNYLREIIPMLVKHKIPPTPENYALWYNYAVQNNPALNEKLMQTIQDHGTCTRTDSQKLMQEFVLETPPADPEAYHQLDTIMSEFEGMIEQTHSGTDDFSQSLEQSIQLFSEAAENPDKFQNLVTTVTDNTEAIFALTQSFQEHMSSSQLEIKGLKAELKKQHLQVITDALTKIYNRRAFDEKIEELTDTNNASFCLVIFDIDHFKKFNDTYGHTFGDRVLQGVAKTTEQAIATIKNTHFSRYGGEEFALLIPDCKLENATIAAETIRIKLEQLGIRSKSGTGAVSNITASFGVAQHMSGELSEDLVNRVDDALYLAKTNGRNQVHTG